MQLNEYALYKNDLLLDIGTIPHLSAKFRIKERSVRFYATPSYQKRVKKGLCLVKIESEDE
jgi:hypothetical protein